MENLIGIFIIVILGSCIFYGLKKNRYDKSNYKRESGNNFLEVMRDKGKYGEYLSFNILEKIKGEHRILTNVYLPKGNGETTEVDLIYIHETGIYVLESKNYSGWIFGDEKSKYWMQILKNRQKDKFYNPIWQNNTHVKYLLKLLKIDEKLIKSLIVFSERCTIKKMEVNSENVKVLNRYNLDRTIEKLVNNSPKVFEAGKIIELYYELKPYTCVKDELKEKHIEQIKQKHNLDFKPKEITMHEEENIKEELALEVSDDNKKLKAIEKDAQINHNIILKKGIVTQKIKDKLDSCEGKAKIKLFKGDSCEISYDPNGKGLTSPKIPVPNQLTWEDFEAAVEVVINNGGKASKGTARSKGARLGNEKLPMNSVEGYIAHKVHGVKEGESSFGPGFVICAVLDWADICNNERGFVTIKPSFLVEIEDSEKEE